MVVLGAPCGKFNYPGFPAALWEQVKRRVDQEHESTGQNPCSAKSARFWVTAALLGPDEKRRLVDLALAASEYHFKPYHTEMCHDTCRSIGTRRSPPPFAFDRARVLAPFRDAVGKASVMLFDGDDACVNMFIQRFSEVCPLRYQSEAAAWERYEKWARAENAKPYGGVAAVVLRQLDSQPFAPETRLRSPCERCAAPAAPGAPGTPDICDCRYRLAIAINGGVEHPSADRRAAVKCAALLCALASAHDNDLSPVFASASAFWRAIGRTA